MGLERVSIVMTCMYHPYVWVEGSLPTTDSHTPMRARPVGLTDGPLRDRDIAHAKRARPLTYERGAWLTQYRRARSHW